jgi:protein gp37
MSTKIEYVDESINPIRTKGGGWHCVKSSAGCSNCYAEKINKRFGDKKTYAKGDIDLVLNVKSLEKPLKWNKPKKIFIQDMSDLFLPGISTMFPDYLHSKYLCLIIDLIKETPQHTYLMLTKHPEEMKLLFMGLFGDGPGYWHEPLHFDNGKPLPNLWLGVTAENQEQADKRIPILLQIPAAVRFVSVEPMLGPVDLTNVIDHVNDGVIVDALNRWCCDIGASSHEIPFGLDWVIIGAESGPKARKTENHHILHLIQQCSSANVPVFLKQIWVKGNSKPTLVKLPKLGGQVWDQIPKQERL